MNGHLLRYRCACFAKRAEMTIDSATERRSALSGPEGRPSVTGRWTPCSRRLATHLQKEKCWKSPKGASDAFLNRLRLRILETGL